jgi:hypothetical protein
MSDDERLDPDTPIGRVTARQMVRFYNSGVHNHPLLLAGLGDDGQLEVLVATTLRVTRFPLAQLEKAFQLYRASLEEIGYADIGGGGTGEH